MLSSYLCILLIPILALCFAYYQSYALVRQEVLRANSHSAERAYADVYAALNPLTSTLMRILSNARVRDIAGEAEKRQPYKIYEIKQYLDSLRNEAIYDILLYNHATGMVTSAAFTRLETALYLRYYLCPELLPLAEWERQLRAYNIHRLDAIPLPEGAWTLAMYQSYPLNSRKSADTTAAVILSERTLSNWTASVAELNGAVMILDQDCSIVYSSDRALAGAHALGALPARAFTTVKLNSREYFAERFDLPFGGYSFFVLIPASAFLSKLSGMRAVFTLLITLMSALSIALSVLLARRNYNPFARLLALIRRRDAPFTRSEALSEPEYICCAFEDILKQNRIMANRLQIERMEFHDQLLFKAFHQLLPSEDQGFMVLKQAGFDFRSNNFLAALYYSEADWDPKQARRCILAARLPDTSAYAIAMDAHTIACLYNPPDECGKQTLLSHCEGTCARLKQQFNQYCICAAGTIYHDLSGIQKTFAEAARALEYRFVPSQGSFICFDNIKTRAFGYNYGAISRAVPLMRAYLAESDADARATLDIIERDCIKLNTASLETIRCFKHDLTTQMGMLLSQARLLSQEEETRLIERLIDAPDYERFRERFIEALKYLRAENETLKQERDIARRVQDYIDAHYAEDDLNVNRLGMALELSPSYVSKLYRDRSGRGVLDAISERRVARAKQLLITGELSMDEIARRTGYLSDSAFIRAFKKQEGITPGQYRKLYIKTT